MAELKDQIKAALEAKEVEFVMGWQKGFDGLHATPLYMRRPEDVEKLIWGPLNVHSLATYLPLFKGKKVGIVVKGCDSRGVVELLQENLINREDVVVFGMGCNGTIDINRVLAKDRRRDGSRIRVTGSGATLKVRADGKDYEFAMQDVAQEQMPRLHRAQRRHPRSLRGLAHEHPGRRAARHARDHDLPRRPEPREPHGLLARPDGSLHPLLRLPQRLPHVRVPRQLRGGQPRTRNWLTQEDSPTQKMFFQLIHAHAPGRTLHLAAANASGACPDGHPGREPSSSRCGRVVKKLFEYARRHGRRRRAAAARLSSWKKRTFTNITSREHERNERHPIRPLPTSWPRWLAEVAASRQVLAPRQEGQSGCVPASRRQEANAVRWPGPPYPPRPPCCPACETLVRFTGTKDPENPAKLNIET